MKLEALTPRDDLHEGSFKVYKHYLDDAFENPKIRNLALSGSLGSGKSSIIRSYDRARNYGKKHFLYVSLMSFSNQTGGTATDDQKQLEYSLLNQIMSCCTAKDLPEGSINGIPEKFKWLRTCSIWLSALCLSIYILIFHSQFGKLAAKLAKKTLFGFELSKYLSEDIRSWVHLGLYAFVGVILFICVFCILRRCLPFFRLSKLTVKANNAEAEVLMGKERTSLDVYKFELAYALGKIGKKYDYTVVFEDLERLDTSVAVDIMEKLRELNTLTNNHIQTVKPKQALKIIRKFGYMLAEKESPAWFRKAISACCTFFDKECARNLVRFIYPINERTIGYNDRTKFFDCIIPIVPVSHALNSKFQLSSMMEELYIKEPLRQKLCDSLSEAILDNRTRLTLRNEFLVLWLQHVCQIPNIDLIQTQGQQSKATNTYDNSTVSQDDINRATMLAIAAYKILLPEVFEYALSPQGDGVLYPFNLPSDKEYLDRYLKLEPREKAFDAIKKLYENELLHKDSLKLIIGEQELLEQWLNLLQKSLDKDRPTAADKNLAEWLIGAIKNSTFTITNVESFENFRKSMTNRLHSLVSENQEQHFLLVASSLASTSRQNVAEDWKWLKKPSLESLSKTALKRYFCRCVVFLSSGIPIQGFMSNTLSDLLSTVLESMSGENISDDETKWNDNMFSLISNCSTAVKPLVGNADIKYTTIGSVSLDVIFNQTTQSPTP